MSATLSRYSKRPTAIITRFSNKLAQPDGLLAEALAVSAKRDPV